MTRKWTVTLPKCEPLTATVRAYDVNEALELAAEELGIAVEPCCELEDAPCAECDADERWQAEDRAVEAAREAERGSR
ncbi:MAG: hypothetical protein ACT4PE_05695 [Candidatus Eiseniibacteriota bacterium]